MAEHIPVMAGQVVDWISPERKGRYVDATAGLGGHTLALLRAGAGMVLALDRDQSALNQARKRIQEAGFLHRVVFWHAQHENAAEIMDDLGWEKAQGLVLDAGVSSMQLEDPERGFSFVHDGPLDMRMDEQEREDAADLVNRAPEQELKQIIRKYGQEPLAGRIARRIIQEREKKRIDSTGQLADIVSKAYPPQRRAKSRNHPATKTFQALRIAVNRELEGLQALMKDIPDILAPEARAVVITFHSLEDRIVKHAFRRLAKGCVCPPQQAVCTCDPVPRIKVLTKKPALPGDQEIAANNRSRSAKMRVAEVLK
ncbi:MAG: 16S rRNA (cytosine(1402)-N(4))-methyltransferase RsmH [Desulfovermiculus sp.]